MKALHVNQRRASDFERMLTVPMQTWNNVYSSVKTYNQYFLTTEELSEFCTKYLDPAIATILVANAISLRRFADDERIEPKVVLDSLKAGFSNFGWSAEKINENVPIFNFLEQFIETEKVRVAAKSSDLYYKHAWHLHEAKIISDLRPVFNGSRSGIVALICKNILHIKYSNGLEEENTIEIPLGIDQLENLQLEIKSALDKTRCIDNQIAQKIGLPIRNYRSDKA